MVKISLLIAVYNSEAYLRTCLDSLLAQTYGEFQAICVDDGSTDGSPEVLNEYARLDPRFTVISLPANMGQAVARNEGLKHAQGAYTAMLDSDDWLAPDALETAMKVIEENHQTDAVLFDLHYAYPDGHYEPYPHRFDQAFTGEEAFRLSLDWKLHGVYLIRTSIHKRFPYDTSARLYSDDNTTRLHYLACNEVRTSRAAYYYRQHEHSATHQVSMRRFDRMLADESMKQALEGMNIRDEDLNRFETYRWLVVVACYGFYLNNRKTLGQQGSREALLLIWKYWKTIEVERLPYSTRLKPGFIPFRCSWTMFRLEEWAYFTMKRLLRRSS
jgi:glycosyltransferase involved in cell wall biosynthesis